MRQTSIGADLAPEPAAAPAEAGAVRSFREEAPPAEEAQAPAPEASRFEPAASASYSASFGACTANSSCASEALPGVPAPQVGLAASASYSASFAAAPGEASATASFHTSAQKPIAGRQPSPRAASGLCDSWPANTLTDGSLASAGQSRGPKAAGATCNKSYGDCSFEEDNEGSFEEDFEALSSQGSEGG